MSSIDQPDDVSYLWFSGKGGTGKTTIATATALQLAERGHEVLLVSTDPAHSVGDALDMALDGKTRVVEGLEAVEVDPEEEVEEFREQLSLDQFGEETAADIYEGLDLLGSGPGVAEAAALHRFMEFMHDDAYDAVVFDTAPTGHTLQLLQLPEVMESMIGTALRMRMRFTKMVDTVKTLFGKGGEVDSGVEQLERMKERVKAARRVMRDPSRTAFNFVLLPEAMSVAETRRAVERVEESGMQVSRLFVNKLVPEQPDCPFCTSRRAMQQDHLVEIRELFGDRDVVTVPLFSTEVQGIDRLRHMADAMRPLPVSDHEEAEGSEDDAE